MSDPQGRPQAEDGGLIPEDNLLPFRRPAKTDEQLQMEREIRAHNLRADAALLRKQRRAWKRSRPKP